VFGPVPPDENIFFGNEMPFVKVSARQVIAVPGERHIFAFFMISVKKFFWVGSGWLEMGSGQ
jgi:hypothetical protein